MLTLSHADARKALRIAHRVCGNPTYTNTRKKFRHIKYTQKLLELTRQLRGAGIAHEFRHSDPFHALSSVAFHIPLDIPIDEIRLPVKRKKKDPKLHDTTMQYLYGRSRPAHKRRLPKTLTAIVPTFYMEGCGEPIAVFTTKAKAERYLPAYKQLHPAERLAGVDYELHEVDLDPAPPKKSKK